MNFAPSLPADPCKTCCASSGMFEEMTMSGRKSTTFAETALPYAMSTFLRVRIECLANFIGTCKPSTVRSAVLDWAASILPLGVDSLSAKYT